MLAERYGYAGPFDHNLIKDMNDYNRRAWLVGGLGLESTGHKVVKNVFEQSIKEMRFLFNTMLQNLIYSWTGKKKVLAHRFLVFEDDSEKVQKKKTNTELTPIVPLKDGRKVRVRLHF